MCVKSRSVRNKYTGKFVRVSCGKCESCRQEKALARANRIRLNSSQGNVALFVTLTYENDYLPYVRKSEIESDESHVYIYRRKSVRLYRGRKCVSLGGVIDCCLKFDDYDCSDLKFPRRFGDDDCVGVCYYPDFQRFLKRLRINLKRQNYDKKFSYFGCSEYGSVSQRPHFHALIFIPKDDVEIFRSAISKSWIYADRHRTEDFIEIAKDASSYVASYVNSPHSLESVLSSHSFKQKHSFSKGFGASCGVFSLRSVVEKIQRGDLLYSCPTFKDGVPCLSSVPIPQYVINRYFPKFKGYCLLSDAKIRELLLRTSELRKTVSSLNSLFEWTDDDEYHFHRRMISIRKMFCDVFHWDFQRFEIYYPLLYTKVWTSYKSLLLRKSYDMICCDADWSSFYENAGDFAFGVVRSPYFREFLESRGLIKSLVLDPNARPDIFNKTMMLRDIFYKMDKSKRVVNKVMSDIGYNV